MKVGTEVKKWGNRKNVNVEKILNFKCGALHISNNRKRV